MSEKGLRFENAEIFHEGRRLLHLDTHIAPGEVLTLMGPSGSGKSTLISAMAGFLPRAFSASGRILLDGEEMTCLPPEKRQMGVLFQDPLLFPHLSVAQNIAFALPPGGKTAQRREEVKKLLDAVELTGYAERDPATLSGGQQARVALIRVLASAPRALLLDEPFSKLDMQLRGSVRDLVFAEVKRRQLPALLVTHDEADAEAAKGQVIALKG